ncbi:MAG: hypothetical protein AAGG44_11340 [Planctomycetota bacterium]
MTDVKQRPSWLKALGSAEPPKAVQIDQIEYRLIEVYKHDSWAATAQYQSFVDAAVDQQPPKKIICKFNRRSNCFGIPLSWVGRTLAARESSAYSTLAELDVVPSALGDVYADGRILSNAFAHEFVEGHPLGEDERPQDEFFPSLQNALSAMHELGVVYMDLHKRENILVGADGLPKLVDFQISFQHRPRGWLAVGPGRWLRDILRKSDLFCFEKHVRRLRPDQAETLGVPLSTEPPWWIRAHRMIAVPFRQSRRRLLSWLRVRDRSGRCRSELFAEHAFREPLP